MPPRKEQKDAVIYAASKRKPPPFKPLRPSKLPKNAATSADGATSTARHLPQKSAPKPARKTTLPDSDEEQNAKDNDDGDEDDELDNSALTTVRRSKSRAGLLSDDSDPTSLPAPPKSKRKSIREPSPLSASSQETTNPLPSARTVAATEPASATEGASANPDDSIPPIPSPLLVRLLYEKFHDKSTQIDKPALRLVQKYLEIFVREAIARTALEKRDEAARGVVSQLEGTWLELEDLEKVAPGLMMDF